MANYMSIFPFFFPLMIFTLSLALGVASFKIFAAVSDRATQETVFEDETGEDESIKG